MKSSLRFEEERPYPEVRPHPEQRPEAARSAVGRQPAAEHFPVAVEVSVADRRAARPVEPSAEVAVVAPEGAAEARRLT